MQFSFWFFPPALFLAGLTNLSKVGDDCMERNIVRVRSRCMTQQHKHNAESVKRAAQGENFSSNNVVKLDAAAFSFNVRERASDQPPRGNFFVSKGTGGRSSFCFRGTSAHEQPDT